MENLPDFRLDPPAPAESRLYRCDICDGHGYVSEPTQSDCLCVCHEGYRQRENEDPRQRDYCQGCREFHLCHFCEGAGESETPQDDEPQEEDFAA